MVKTHDSHTLHCRTSPTATRTRWKLNGDYLEPSPERGVEIRQNGDLHITSFKHKPKEASHAGVYQCVATTELGTLVSREVTLERAGWYCYKRSTDIKLAHTVVATTILGLDNAVAI